MRYSHRFTGNVIKKLSGSLVNGKFLKTLRKVMSRQGHATAHGVQATRGETKVQNQAMLEQARYNGEAVAAVSACRLIR